MLLSHLLYRLIIENITIISQEVSSNRLSRIIHKLLINILSLLPVKVYNLLLHHGILHAHLIVNLLLLHHPIVKHSVIILRI